MKAISMCKIRYPAIEGRHYTNQGIAWIGLCLALAIHVTDEAVTDFLSVYNPAVLALRQRLPLLPLPTFTYEVWLAGLILAVTILLLLSPFAFRGVWWMKWLSYVFGALMTGNGLLHIVGSFYLRRLMPGVYSSPLLLTAAIYLMFCTHRHQWQASLLHSSADKR